MAEEKDKTAGGENQPDAVNKDNDPNAQQGDEQQPDGTQGAGDGSQGAGTDGAGAGEGDAKGKEGTDGADGKGKEDAPAEIVYDFKLPEGVKADDKKLSDFTEKCKTGKVSKETAQEILNFLYENEKAISDEAVSAFGTMVTNWENETKSKFTPEQIGIAKKIAQEQGGEEFVKLLEETKFGSHPVIIGFLEKISKPFLNDKFVAGKSSAGEESAQDKLDKMYGKTK